MIAVVDYAAGNLKSVTRALDFLQLENEATNDPAKIRAADAIIIPGVGAAGAAMRNLQKDGLVEVLREEIPRKPFLGICLGLQILFEKSAEDGVECLGIFPGEVVKLPNSKVKIPHIGWNPVDFGKTPRILTGIKTKTPFYFVHSYVARPTNSEIVKATTKHGETFPAVVQRENIWAVQFHPEKSGEVGLQVLKNFGELI
ncbi:MAG: imidazole glycerol phosphate synthase subunit HisH [Patescibacteria group bacterium]